MSSFEKVSLNQWVKDGGNQEDYLNVIIPKRATSGSAGYDFFSPISVSLKPGEEIKIATGIKAELPKQSVLLIFPRSGMGFKYFARLANTVGVVDEDYYNNPGNEGHIFIKIRNEGNIPLQIESGNAFAQGVIVPYLKMDDEGSDMGLRIGGMGSTSND